MNLFYQCEHCEYYIQHYNITQGRICKVNCGYCKYRDKEKKASLRDCKYFKQINKEEKDKQNQEYFQQYEKHIFKILHRIEKSLKCFKLYLNKNQDCQKLDTSLIEE